MNSGAFQRKDLRLFQPTEWVIPSAGFFSKTIECDALVQNGAFFMELDAASTLGQIEKGINPDVIGAISPKRNFALVYIGEIIAQGNRYDKAYQEILMRLKQASYDVEKERETRYFSWNESEWRVKNGLELPKAHKEFQIAITSEKGAKILTKYLKK